ncbi:unnamed protein product [Schistosoma margrebowiei]|uniref:Uncharacterized protein n=1 Tax=Schistosoma margrebowiei TaxID=48269 RepID=A0A183LJY9_9TREM|nr:unnamed protein product [Schistosoma margrebowiei]
MPPLGKSDHAVLTFDFHSTSSHEHASVQSRHNVWKANIPDIMHSASLIDWTIDPDSSIETAWDAFRNSYLKVATPHIPWTIPKGPKNSTPWFTREVRILLRKRKKVWDRFRLLVTNESKSQYRKARNTCALILRKSRKLYEEKLVKESIECPKRLYSYINQRTRSKGNIPALWGDSTASSLVEDDFGPQESSERQYPGQQISTAEYLTNQLSAKYQSSIILQNPRTFSDSDIDLENELSPNDYIRELKSQLQSALDREASLRQMLSSREAGMREIDQKVENIENKEVKDNSIFKLPKNISANKLRDMIEDYEQKQRILNRKNQFLITEIRELASIKYMFTDHSNKMSK